MSSPVSVPQVPGLYLYQEVMSSQVEETLIRDIDRGIWSAELSRRTQQYGVAYDYRSRTVGQGKKVTPIPEVLHPFLRQLEGIGLGEFQQCIINEYRRGQGISPHIDHPGFGPIVVSYSLGAPANMIFSRGDDTHTLLLSPRSLVVLTGEARESWKHSIPCTNTITTPEGKIQKDPHYRRISLTFRSVPS